MTKDRKELWSKGPRVREIGLAFDRSRDEGYSQHADYSELASLAFTFAGEADWLEQNPPEGMIDQAYEEASLDIWQRVARAVDLHMDANREDVIAVVQEIVQENARLEAENAKLLLEMADLKELLINVYVARVGCQDEDGNSPQVLAIAPRIEE